ncbi:MAG: hypothetical protein HWD61_14205 [Parachlamydiaceae bacterium]|nr:MAG: hypothetical protein HWD61_14205 [Parachlamydiaceae bacterium]
MSHNHNSVIDKVGETSDYNSKFSCTTSTCPSLNEYLTKGKVILNEENVIDLYDWAKTLKLAYLKESCRVYFIDQLSQHNFSFSF